jgi:hypothetical protein
MQVMSGMTARCLDDDDDDDDCETSGIVQIFTRVIARNDCLQASNHRKIFIIADTHLTTRL